MTDSISGHVAIVTGSGRGIGRGIAEALAGAGARVVVADIDRESAKTTTDALGSRGGEALDITVDVSNRTSIQEMVARALDTWDHIDILVNCAGINASAPALEMSDDTWQRVLSVNLTGVLMCCQTVGKHMVERGYGRIVNISSSSAHFGAPNLAAYATSKAGVLALTRVMAVEWSPHGVTVNAVCPGNVGTEMLYSVLERRADTTGEPFEDILARISAATPALRLGTPTKSRRWWRSWHHPKPPM